MKARHLEDELRQILRYGFALWVETSKEGSKIFVIGVPRGADKDMVWSIDLQETIKMWKRKFVK